MAQRPVPPSTAGYSAADKQRILMDYERKVREFEDQQGREDLILSRAEADRLYKRSQDEEERKYQRGLSEEERRFQREKNLVKTNTTENVMPDWNPPDSYDVPVYTPYIPGAAPTYSAPRWNEDEISSLTQKRAAPGLRALRQQVQRVSGRRFDNPQVGRMTLRDALQGYGSGIGSVISSANEGAVGEYGKKYSSLADEAKTNYGGQMSQWSAENQAKGEGARLNYQAELEKRRTAFNTAWDKWKASSGTRTTSRTV